MRVLVCGGRDFPDRLAVSRALDELLGDKEDEYVMPKIGSVVIHGACPTGADRHADDWAVCNWREIEAYPADWAKHGRAAGPIRNQQMADMKPDIVLAFPTPGAENRGTKDMIRRALKAGITVRIHEDQTGATP